MKATIVALALLGFAGAALAQQQEQQVFADLQSSGVALGHVAQDISALLKAKNDEIAALKKEIDDLKAKYETKKNK